MTLNSSAGRQMIEIRDVYKVFERKGISSTALQGVSLTVEKGDIFGVIGYSGAGKSTLIRLVNRLERPTGGQVFIEGQPLDSLNAEQLRALKKRIGMIFQHFNLLESGTVYHNVAIPLILQKSRSKRSGNGSASCWNSSALATKPQVIRANCRAAKNSGSGSPGRWPPIRPFCCATNLPRRWTRKPRKRFCSCLDASTPNTILRS